MTFLSAPDPSPGAERLYEADRDGYGFVMNLTHLWAHHPESMEHLAALLTGVAEHAGLSVRDKGVLVTAIASTTGDSYCATAWGWKLAGEADAALAAAVLTGDDEPLTERERALAAWARAVASDPHARTAAEVQSLRDAGFDDSQVFALTAYIGFRLAFSAINSSLGAGPDAELGDLAPREVLDAVTWGRPRT